MLESNLECHVCNEKKEIFDFSGLICQNCKSERKKLRDRIQREDAIRRQSEGEVNKIFKIFDQLKSQEPVSVKSVDLYPEVPSIDLNSIKALSIQLLKLDSMSLKIKSNYLKKALVKTEQKIEHIASRVENSKADLVRKKEVSEEERQMLIEKSFDTSNLLSRSIEELESNKINQVKKQAIRIQKKKFDILKEMTITKSNGRYLFMNQSILKLEDFLGCNILVINQFLENIIVFQSHLADVFEFEIPFLDDLINLLPDSAFFNLIKDRGDLLSGTDNILANEEENGKEQEKHLDQINTIDSGERVIKLGNTIKLPLSSKTINNQRRASLTRTPETEETISSPPKEKQASPLKALGNKKLIIVPHKLLVKPFNKLSIKEFLRFLGVLVKIVTNFKVFAILAGTNNQVDSIEDYIYDFEKTLNLVCSSGSYFDNMLKDLSSNSFVASSSSSTSDISSAALYSPGDVLELKVTMDKVYQSIVKKSPKTTGYNTSNATAPSIFHDLNLSDLIANQAKFHLDDWDIVSKIFDVA